MAYRVFISHSTHDQGLVVALSNLLAKYGIDVSVAEWCLKPGHPLAPKVRAHIRSADCVVVFLTRNGTRSSWVQQEVGIAFGLHKLLVPLVEKGTSARELAVLQGLEWIEYDASSPQEALAQASDYVHALRLSKEQREKALLVTGGIIAFLLLLSYSTERK